MTRAARAWGGRGLARFLWPGFWLVYLAQPIDGVGRYSHGTAAVAGYCVVGAFAVTYLVAVHLGWTGRHRAYWVLYGVGLALTVAACFFARSEGLTLLDYLAVLTVASQIRAALPIVLTMTVATAVLPLAVHGWGGRIDWNDGLTVLLVSLAMWGFFRIVAQNIALSAARAEVARLAAENERSRIARDLHDLLGHSLTTITVKAGLARRLAEKGDADEARREIAEVEQLSRRTLGDVRAAVSSHREVTLTGELATAREVLRAADITAELPASVAETDPSLSELFGWVVREGVTNVVRHSRGPHIWITLGRREIAVQDDGNGSASPPGNGLRGLRERAEALGGTLTFGSGPGGSRLQVVVPEPADAREETVGAGAIG